MSMKPLTHDQYKAVLLTAHPNYELKSVYSSGRGKVTVHCCTHGETHQVTARSLTTSNQSLKCCGKARQHTSRREKGIKSLLEGAARHGRVEVLSADGYTNNRSKVLCRCLICKETAKAEAANIYVGQGIDCSCRLAVRVQSGKKAWSHELVMQAVAAREAAGWSNPHDSVALALKGDVLPGTCDLYLYESPVKGLSKFGISNDCERRSKQDGYGLQLVPHRSYASRVTAILIEQAYKYSYGVKAPAQLSDWCGRTELTDATPEEFEERINELEAALQELGLEAFASEYTGINA